MVITSIRDAESGLDALWERGDFEPAAPGRALGPGGNASIDTFADVFSGGWFTMIPSVGFPGTVPGPAGPMTTLLHGEACRLPWNVTWARDDGLEAELRLIRSPLRLVRRISLEPKATLRLETTIENLASVPVPFAWGEHPCFSRSTFAGGRIDLQADWAIVPDDGGNGADARLAAGRTGSYPIVMDRDRQPFDIGAIPLAADGRHEQVLVGLRGGVIRLQAPSAGRCFRLEFDVATFPYALIWQDYVAQSASFWGTADVFAVEPMNVSSRSMEEAVQAGSLRTLAPKESTSTTILGSWEADGLGA
jgi:galactose mutarotase-like enzyme